MASPTLRILAACASLVVGSLAHAQSEELLKAEAWEGSFNLHATGSGKDGAYGNEHTWAYDGDAKGTFVLDTFKDDTPPTWSGHWQGSANIHWKTRTTKYASINCAQEEDGDASGEALNPNPRHGDIDLRLHEDGWEIRIWRNKVPSRYVRRCVFPDGHASSERFSFAEFIPFGSPLLAYSATGTLLSGTYQVTSPIGSSSITQALQRVSWQGEVRARPQGDLILEVESPSYENWQPSAAVNSNGGAAPGTPIEFTATLKHKSGKPAEVAIDHVVWELVDTSREPGVAINFPQASDSDFDLRFDPLPGQVPANPDRQVVTSAIVDKATARARVVPLDWGGWSVLRVTAFVHNGPTVVGRYKGSAESDARLPKRAANSLIADAWKKEVGSSGADDEDSDNAPTGDRYDGDGLTLYEEYRGWYEQGKHRSGNPKLKDYFVRNETGSLGEDGIRLMADRSRLAVHRLLATEFDSSSRVINRQHARAPHVVDQHGVIMKFDPANGAGWSLANGGPGTPGAISYIGMDIAVLPYARAREGAVIAAHELLHTVNVWHHGKDDWDDQKWSVQHGRLIEIGTRIQVFWESNTSIDRTPAWIAAIGEGRSISRWIGQPQGQHSGAEDCLMRYHVSKAYPSSTDPRVRYELLREPVGDGLCTTGEGNGINARGHRPQPRYFSAAPKRGNCAAQIRVNDRGTAPVR